MVRSSKSLNNSPFEGGREAGGCPLAMGHLRMSYLLSASHIPLAPSEGGIIISIAISYIAAFQEAPPTSGWRSLLI